MVKVSNAKFILNIAKLTRRIRFRGLERLLRLIYNPDKRKDDYLSFLAPYDENSVIFLDTRSYQDWNILFQGYYERGIVSLLKRLIRQGDCVIEVGANIGSHTIIISRRVGTQGTVLAFEPHPKVIEKLTLNLKANRIQNVRIFKCALSDSSQKFTSFYTSEGNFATEEMNSSLFPDDRLSLQIQVECKTLDETFLNNGIDRCDLIKIDTEGNEFRVLLGAKQTIDTFRPYILFEYSEINWTKAGSNWSSVKLFFKELNYSLHTISNDGYMLFTDDYLLTDGDVIAIPK